MFERLRPHKQQSQLYRTRARYPIVAAGRGSGKTELARRRLVRALAERIPGNKTPEYFYGLPTYGQAKRVAWRPLKSIIPPDWIKDKSESELRIETVFGSVLQIVSFDAPQRVEGTQWVGGIIDESSDEPPGLFDLTIRPALTRWNGWCWRIGVPKRFGVGAEDFKKAFDLGLSGADPDIVSFHWESETVLSPEECARIQATMDSRDYNEQYKARWETISGAIFHAFNEKVNVTTSAKYVSDQPIVVGSDFNVNPMCWTLSHAGTDGLVTFDEIMLRNTNTDETLKVLKERYGDHEGGWVFTGDASGQARRSSAFSSDYVQIKNFSTLNLKGNVKLLYLSANPPIANRFASCNALLCNAKGQARAFINPKCKRLIADLKHRSFKKETREPNDKGDMGHMSDAWGYTIYRLFPLRIIQETQSRIITSLS